MKTQVRLLIVGCWLLSVQSLWAQQYPLFTNYLTNSIGFNPATVTTDEGTNARLIYRKQWVGFEGGPDTRIASVYGKLRHLPISLGGYGFSDQAGDLVRTGGVAILGVSQKLSESTSLGLGLSGGYFQTRLSKDFKANSEVDPLLDAARMGIRHPDFSAGLFLRSGNLTVGASVPQVFRTQLNFNNTENGRSVLERHYYGFAAYQIPLTERIAIEPGLQFKKITGQSPQFDAMVRAVVGGNFWLGTNYRHQDAVSICAGVQIKNYLLYYGYDVTTSKIRMASNGSHEVTLGLRLGGVKDKDGDGLADKDDTCPEVPGVANNKGCPANDKDQDGIPDELDKCPEVPGIKENDGCPKNDRDQDGITDDKDKCPNEAGEAKLQGCPDQNKDTDGDGIPDTQDMCPNHQGSRANAGCPTQDSDNDGIRDDIDKCPTIAGNIENMGCPVGDSDQDGILDSVDPCPNEPGTLSNMGCPPGKGPNALTADRDGDGVVDAYDKCPNTPGPVANNGCPVIAPEAKDLLQMVIKNVYFDFDKAEIRPVSFNYLNKLAAWMKQHPEYDLYLAGHTDNIGTEEYNQQLSKNRVLAVQYYLEAQGVPKGRIRSAWFGEKIPIASNLTEEGRRRNRRVEMNFEFD